MKTLLKILMVALIIAIALFAQTPDLILQREITPEYDAYLDSMETVSYTHLTLPTLYSV